MTLVLSCDELFFSKLRSKSSLQDYLKELATPLSLFHIIFLLQDATLRYALNTLKNSSAKETFRTIIPIACAEPIMSSSALVSMVLSSVILLPMN
jgi:hypothetical protein